MIIRNAGIANDEDTFSLYKLRDTAMTTTVDIRKIFKRDDIRGLYPEELNGDTVFLAAVPWRNGCQPCANPIHA